jgi:hypothetical protein
MLFLSKHGLPDRGTPHQTIKNIVPLVTKVVEEKAIHVRRSDLNIMAIGVPNTGKVSGTARQTMLRNNITNQ